MSNEVVPKKMENYKLSTGFVTSGANLGIEKALVDHQDLDSLIGRLMQYIEATYQDKEQREAQKGLVKGLCREWLTHIYDWESGWEVAFHVNPNERPENSAPIWTSKYRIGVEEDDEANEPIKIK